MRRLLFVSAAAAALVAAAPASAAVSPKAPMLLPGDASAATADADPSTWLVGARPSAAAGRIAARAGARRVVPGGYEVPRDRARSLASALEARGVLTYAEPNRYRSLEQRAVPDDPLTRFSRWRDAVIDPALAPPPVTRRSPLLALVDAKARTSHPEFRKGGRVRSPGKRKVKVAHGTETMGIAVAPQNGVGIVGAYPGARAINISLPPKRIRCSDSASGIRSATKAGAAVINMSYGSTAFCETEYLALQRATHRHVTLVAAGGNERTSGNPFEYPGSLPHVLTVGALTPDDQAAFFSNTSPALDLVAPGVGLIAPLPARLDRADNQRDGYEFVDGTSFAAPIVAAAAIWVRTVRPKLHVDQVAQVLRLSATDIAAQGYDTETGYGKLNLANALQLKPPIADPKEPNEDTRFVDGRAFGRPAKPVWRGGKRPGRLQALLDFFEDPSDVYRIRIPAHRAARVKLKPDFGNPDLEVYAGGKLRKGQRRRLIARSRHTGTRSDTVRVRNRGSSARTAFVRAFIRPGVSPLDARYRLTVKR